ncbi:MAG: hypothetical protein R2780_04370 [Crocinitomicaceae bacterium]
MHKIGLLAIILFLTSCEFGEEKKAVPADGTSKVDRFFPRFPDQQFEFICLGDETSVIIEKLEKEGYELKPDHQNQFRNELKEIEVIIPETNAVNSFRVFLYNKYDITCYEEFVTFFSSRSKTKNLSNEFSVFEFETEEMEFTITIFQQPDFIRLNYELKTQH